MKKDSLGIHNSVTHESLFTCKLLGKTLHKMEGVFSFLLSSRMGLEQRTKTIMNITK